MMLGTPKNLETSMESAAPRYVLNAENHLGPSLNGALQ